MKNVSLALNVITIALLIWCYMHYHQMEQQLKDCQAADKKCEALNTKLKNALMAYETGSGGCPQQGASGESFSLDNADAITMVGMYAQDHWEEINKGNRNLTTMNVKGKIDSRSVWFSLSRLKGFINYVESKSNSLLLTAGCCDTVGIRIYFAEYNDYLAGKYGFPANCVQKTTVLMVPTVRWTDGRNHDFNPDFYGINHPFYCSTSNDTQWTVPLAALMMNHGSIIPPPFPSHVETSQAYKNCGADFLIQAVDPVGNNNPYRTWMPADLGTYNSTYGCSVSWQD